MTFPMHRISATLTLGLAAALAACGGNDDNGSNALPQLAVATVATVTSCTDLTTPAAFANTTFTAASAVATGALTIAGNAVPAHCLLTGRMFDRVSVVDAKSYAIGFEMRLPYSWNGRFFYQANGGTDGSVVTANAGFGGGPTTSPLAQGFAVSARTPVTARRRTRLSASTRRPASTMASRPSPS